MKRRSSSHPPLPSLSLSLSLSNGHMKERKKEGRKREGERKKERKEERKRAMAMAMASIFHLFGFVPAPAAAAAPPPPAEAAAARCSCSCCGLKDILIQEAEQQRICELDNMQKTHEEELMLLRNQLASARKVHEEEVARLKATIELGNVRKSTQMRCSMDSYLEVSIAHLVGLPCTNEQLKLKLEQAEQGKRDLQAQVFHLQSRLLEAKEEVHLSAEALKRQIAQTQKLTEECDRLENECTLFKSDREIFREAADEAEQRAIEAENKASELELRLKVVENSAELFNGEVRELKKKAHAYQEILQKAEQEFQVLYEDNQTWSRLFKVAKRVGLEGQSIPSSHIQGIKCKSGKSYRRQP